MDENVSCSSLNDGVTDDEVLLVEVEGDSDVDVDYWLLVEKSLA